jgi:N6-L-threonylcarbamoyladenine synthase
MPAMMMLAIETSCDDTSAAVVGDDRRIYSNVVSSQERHHAPFAGVVPELASRAHVANISYVVREALAKASVTPTDLSYLSVTQGPGLIGSLLVGINFAHGLARRYALPLLPVDHIRGHLEALFLEHGAVPLPALALIVSGGHSHLFWIDEKRQNTLLVKTRDDAAGEAFDKLSKMLGLGFPGGAIVDRLAEQGDANRHRFSLPKMADGSLDFSFSGLKTAARRLIEHTPEAFLDAAGPEVADLCASFRKAVVQQLLHRTKVATQRLQPKTLLLGGGVACNRALRRAFVDLGEECGVSAFLTSPVLSTDNAAMIAAEGWRLVRSGYQPSAHWGPDLSLRAHDAIAPLVQ